MKTVWITAVKENPPRVAAVTQVLKRYGLNCKGHFWVDTPEKMSWRIALDALEEARADVWLILVNGEDIKNPSVRYGLSLMACVLAHRHGGNFPVMTLWNSVIPVHADLPQLLQSADVLQESAPVWPAKIVAKANKTGKATAAAAYDYRVDVQGDERIGQWFEVGPREGLWRGVVFGVCGGGAEINFQAVGAKGVLPEKTVLEYAQQGMKIQAGNRDFTAWAVRNHVASSASYFVRVKGSPEAVLFMPYADDSDVSATVLGLQ